jgi:2-(1,2-epoxy-1,2-dihydrophenyl)acetyl-CoA isomerase
MKPVLLDIDGDVAHLRLNRPEASNALDTELLTVLHEQLQACREAGARAVLLTGEGRNFCAGGDVKAFIAQGERLPAYLREATEWLGRCASALIRLPAPVIAAVQGYAAGGGGLGLVCACDLAIASRSARFLLGATRVGMAPDASASVTLGQIVGFRRAMELALLNDELTAEEALAIGLVNRVVDDGALHSEGIALARELAAGPTEALAATKRLLWDGLGAVIEERLREEGRAVAQLGGTIDAREGLKAVIDKRPPRFVGR